MTSRRAWAWWSWRPRSGRMLASLAVGTTSAVLLTACSAGPTVTTRPSGVPHPPAGWSTVFGDSFNGPAGAPLSSRWRYDTGHYGHGEIEIVTSSTKNVYLSGHGDLDITALDQHGTWTSGRVQTVNSAIGAPAGGELEVTASLWQPGPPGGLGFWPAFWMLGPGQWPETGEIDIMEDANSLSRHSAHLHCGDYPHGPCTEPSGLGTKLEPCPGCQAGFHTYTVLIDRRQADESITWYLDRKQFLRVTERQVGERTWRAAVDHGFTIIFDLAVGGPYPDSACRCTTPDAATSSQATMQVAYVAAYQRKAPSHAAR